MLSQEQLNHRWLWCLVTPFLLQNISSNPSPEAKSGMNTKHTEEAMKCSSYLALDNEISMSIDGMKLEPGTISLHNFWKFSKNLTYLDPQTRLLGLLWGFSSVIQVVYLALLCSNKQTKKNVSYYYIYCYEICLLRFKSKDESRKWCRR